MSDVGLSASLDFDIADALAQVDNLEAQLNQAVTVTIVADTDAATAAVEEALGTVAPTVTPHADTEQLTLDVEGAAAGANVTVAPHADTADLVAEITGAAAETEVVVPVSADVSEADASLAGLGESASESTGGIGGLTGAVAGLSIASSATEGSAEGLTSALGGMGKGAATAVGGVVAVGAATAALFAAGVDAQSAQEQYNLVLGEFADQVRNVDVGGLNTSLEELAIQLGTDDEALLRTAANIFNLGTTSGRSREQVAETTDEIVALAARAVALNPSLGSVATVAEGLTAALARGGRATLRFGIDLMSTEVAARATQLALADGREEVTQFDKSTAGAQIAVEKFGTTLGTTVEEGSRNSEIQLRSLREQFSNLIEQAGQPLVAPILELLEKAIPAGGALAGVIGELAAVALPLLAVGLGVVTPGLEALATVLDAIPTPVLTAIAAFAGFNSLVGLLTRLPALALTAVQGVANAAAGIGLSLASMNPALLAAGAAVAILTVALTSNIGETNVDKQAVDELTAALQQEGAAAEETAGKILANKLANSDAARAANDAGISYGELADVIKSGTEDFGAFDRILVRAQTDTARLGKDESIRRVAQQLTEAGAGATEFGRELLGALRSGELTIEEAQELVNLLEAEHNAWVIASDGAREHKTAIEQVGGAQAVATPQQLAYNAALQEIVTTQPGVTFALASITDGYAATSQELTTLATNIGGAKLTAEQLDAIATSLGVSSESLSTFVKGVTDAIGQMTTDATSKLPTTGEAIDSIVQILGGIPKALDPRLVIEAVRKNIEAIADFQANLDFLAFSGLPNVAAQAAKESPQIAAAIAQGIRDGGPAVAAALEFTLAAAGNKVTDFTAHVQNELAPGLATATGLVGKLASNAFGEAFIIRGPTEEEIQRARFVAEFANVPFAEAMRAVAGDGAVAYQQALGVLPGQTQVTIDGVVTTIGAAAPGAETAGAETGGAAAGGFATGIGGIPQNAADIVGQVRPAIVTAADTLRAVMFTEGFFIGFEFTDGMAQGIADPVGAVQGAARTVAQAAIDAAKAQAGVRSPSTVFAEIGAQMGAGLALGLTSSIPTVSAAASQMVSVSSVAMPMSMSAQRFAGDGVDLGHGVSVIEETPRVVNQFITSPDPKLTAWEAARKWRAEGSRLVIG